MSLFVSNLHPECSETVLYEKFSSFGKIASLEVCRDLETKVSLGYGYVNFENSEDAHKAVETMKDAVIWGNIICIMWARKDPNKFLQPANLVIKNLGPKTNELHLKELFSPFGDILSIEVPKNSKGDSEGYGYVQFAEAGSADMALASLIDTEIEGKKLLISKARQCHKYLSLIRKENESDDINDIYARLNTSLVNRELVVIVMCSHVREVVQDWIGLGHKMKMATSAFYILCLMLHRFEKNQLAFAAVALGLTIHSVHYSGWKRDPLSEYAIQPQKAKDINNEQVVVLVRKPKSCFSLEGILAVSSVGVCAFWIWKSGVIENLFRF